MSFTNHDYRDMQQDIIEVFKKIKLISQKYPNVKFKWSEAREAMRESLKLKNYKKSGISQKLLGNILHIKFNEPIFGPQPYLAIKTKSGEYFHDNLDIQKPFFEWSYTFDDQTIPLNNIETIGWAANDKFGRTYVSRYNSKTKKFKKKII